MAIVHKLSARMGRGAICYVWENLSLADGEGDWLESGLLSDKTVHAFGTYGGGTITMQGSNDPADTKNAVTLTDAGTATDITFTGDGGRQILENYRFVRPLLSGAGGATDIDVYIMGKGSW